jgi:N utilization substance protein B
MLSRRHIRIKVLQALYQYFQNPGSDMAKGNKKLLESIHSIYDLYLYELKTLGELLKIAEDEIERKKSKRLPTQEDLNPKVNFVNNRFLKWLESNRAFSKEVENNHISLGDDREVLKRIYREMEATEEFANYLNLNTPSADDDKNFVKWVYGTYIVNSDSLHQLYESKEMHWADDLDAAQMIATKTIKRFDSSYTEDSSLPKLIKDSTDLDFAEVLYRKSIIKSDEYEKLIHDKAKNWETDRIALIDTLLMKLAITELINFPEIPVKVTLNEYIDISKEYSTPKSGVFINGILDKVKADLIESGDIRKIGRGLL